MNLYFPIQYQPSQPANLWACLLFYSIQLIDFLREAGRYVGDSITAAGGSVWSQDTTNHYTYTTTDKVGIGTATPSEALDVNGNIQGDTAKFDYYEGGLGISFPTPDTVPHLAFNSDWIASDSIDKEYFADNANFNLLRWKWDLLRHNGGKVNQKFVFSVIAIQHIMEE